MNSYGQESISKPCELCGLPMARTGKKYHPDCRRTVDAAKKRMRRRHKQGICDDEAAWRWKEMLAHAEWLLHQPNRVVKPVVGEQGENALIAFNVYLRRPA